MPALTPGQRLGPYEVMSSLGAGGMGEVYRARDTRLGRGKRFLMIQRDPGSVPRQLNVILNWSDELDRLAPAGKR